MKRLIFYALIFSAIPLAHGEEAVKPTTPAISTDVQQSEERSVFEIHTAEDVQRMIKTEIQLGTQLKAELPADNGGAG